MNTQNHSKLRTLLKLIQPGGIVLAPWLEQQGISRDLQQHYIKSGWLKSFGRGAYKRPEDEVHWQGAVNAIQNQTEINVHVGAVSSLSLLGLSHYLRLGQETIYLFSPQKNKLPKWFLDHRWEAPVFHNQTGFLPPDLGLVSFEVGQVTIQISSPERAILECLYLAPREMDLVECYQVMEGLVNSRPDLVMELLEKCRSVQVKRLFLLMAEKAKHQWFEFLEPEKIDLGKGNRSIVKGGVYNSKYLISVPKEIA
jgi:hypothetical protein